MIILVNIEILICFQNITLVKMNPFINYLDMKNFYAIQVIDLRFQVDHITRKKVQLFVEYRVDPANARVFISLITHTENKTVSDGKK